MIPQFADRRTEFGSSSVLTIDCIQRLVNKYTESIVEVTPRRNVLAHVRRVEDEGEEAGEHEEESGQSEQIGVDGVGDEEDLPVPEALEGRLDEGASFRLVLVATEVVQLRLRERWSVTEHVPACLTAAN